MSLGWRAFLLVGLASCFLLCWVDHAADLASSGDALHPPEDDDTTPLSPARTAGDGVGVSAREAEDGGGPEVGSCDLGSEECEGSEGEVELESGVFGVPWADGEEQQQKEVPGGEVGAEGAS
eukprot:RCo046222